MTDRPKAGEQLVKQRQAERFHAIAWPWLADVLRTATILTGKNDADAHDLAQETMLRAFRGIDGFIGSTADAKRWLLTILRNCRTDRLRTITGSRPPVSLDAIELDAADEANPSSADDGAWSEPRDLLNRFADAEIIKALNELPEEIRWTLLLADVEGLDGKEVAEILGVPVGTVKSRTSRGRAMLRAALLPLAKDRRFVKSGT